MVLEEPGFVPEGGRSEAMLSRMRGSFSLEIKPVRAREARTRTRRLLCVEHFRMNGMNRNGSNSSRDSLAIVEGLSRDKRMSMGHRLGWTAFARSREGLLRSSVAIFSSLHKKGCNDGYL